MSGEREDLINQLRFDVTSLEHDLEEMRKLLHTAEDSLRIAQKKNMDLLGQVKSLKGIVQAQAKYIGSFSSTQD